MAPQLHNPARASKSEEAQRSNGCTEERKFSGKAWHPLSDDDDTIAKVSKAKLSKANVSKAKQRKGQQSKAKHGVMKLEYPWRSDLGLGDQN